MDLDPPWTPLHRLNRVDRRDVTCPRCRFLGVGELPTGFLALYGYNLKKYITLKFTIHI